MITRKIVALATAAATLAGLAAAPATASAQTYYDYDQCQRDNGNRGLTGGAIGGLAGGVIGNQASARGRHTENTLLGAGIGAVAGALIGRGNTRCPTPQAYNGYNNAPPVVQGAYDNRGAYDAPGIADRGYDRSYDRGYADQSYTDRAYDRYYGEGYYAPPPPQVVYVAPPPVYVAPPVYGPSFYFGIGGGRGGYGRGGYGYGRGGRW